MNFFPIDFPKKFNIQADDVPKIIQALKDELREQTLHFEDEFVRYKEAGEPLKVEMEFASERTKLDYGTVLAEFNQMLR